MPQNPSYNPRVSFQSSRHGYDPIYAHQRWQYRQDPQWEHRVAADFQNRRDHEDLRPPHTWAAQGEMGARAVQAGGRSPVVAAPLAEFSRSKNSPLRFQPVDQSERQRLAEQRQAVQTFLQQRQTVETNAAGAPAEARPKVFAPARMPFLRSPIVARPAAELGTGHAPPQMYDAPKPDPSVAAKPRINRSPGQPQRQPQAERKAPQPQGNAPAGPPAAESKQDKHPDEKGKVKQ